MHDNKLMLKILYFGGHNSLVNPFGFADASWPEMYVKRDHSRRTIHSLIAAQQNTTHIFSFESNLLDSKR